MKRTAFNFFAALSLPFFLLSGAMWVRSHWQDDHLRIHGDWFFDSDRGSLSVEKWELLKPDPFSEHLYSKLSPASPWPAITVPVSGARIYYVSAAVWTGVLPFLCLLAWALERQMKIESARFCAKCGYDLHATPDRCRECGLIPVRSGNN